MFSFRDKGGKARSILLFDMFGLDTNVDGTVQRGIYPQI